MITKFFPWTLFLFATCFANANANTNTNSQDQATLICEGSVAGLGQSFEIRIHHEFTKSCLDFRRCPVTGVWYKGFGSAIAIGGTTERDEEGGGKAKLKTLQILGCENRILSFEDDGRVDEVDLTNGKRRNVARSCQPDWVSRY